MSCNYNYWVTSQAVWDRPQAGANSELAVDFYRSKIRRKNSAVRIIRPKSTLRWNCLLSYFKEWRRRQATAVLSYLLYPLFISFSVITVRLWFVTYFRRKVKSYLDMLRYVILADWLIRSSANISRKLYEPCISAVFYISRVNQAYRDMSRIFCTATCNFTDFRSGL